MKNETVVEAPKACPHGHRGYCGFCAEKTAPRCKKHGIPDYCGFCGPVVEPKPNNRP